MSDIFTEVDEDVRRERLKKLWDRYSIYVVALALLIIAGISAWRGYEWWQNKKAVAAGAAFEAAVTLSDAGKHAEAEAAFAKAALDAPAGYRTLARLRAANELAHSDAKQAVQAYDALAADASLSQTLRDLAGLRASMLLLDATPFAELRTRLEPLAEPNRPFRHTAREFLALSAWHGGDIATARRYIDMIMADGDSPPGTRDRIGVLSALIAAAGKG